MEKKQNIASEAALQPLPTQEERLMAAFVRMAKRRHAVSCPDAAEAWKSLEPRLPRLDDNKPETEEQRLHATIRRLKLWASAATGVAAALIGVLIVLTLVHRESEKRLVALDYDDSPASIYIQQEDEKPVDLTGKNSLDLRRSPAVGGAKKGKQQQLSTPRGMDFKVILPDGTEVWLNAESTIKFPSAFNQGARRVELEGEAYFKVAHNAQKPFTVSTKRMDVRVLGTEFNLRCYETSAPLVSLVKGSVEVMDAGGNASKCRLKPGQGAWFDGKGRLHVSEIDTYGVTQWTDGFFYFDDSTLHDILCELGRWYNMGVVFENPAAASLKLHFTASRKDGISEALSAINSMLNAQVSVEGTSIIVR